MHLLDQRILGIAILFLLGMLVMVKQVATGSILDKPKGNLMMQLVNVFNLFFLLVVNPLAAILLILRRLPTLDPTRMTINETWIIIVLEIAGLMLYVTGYLLMAWALVSLAHNYQLGGSTPRSDDKIVTGGPYNLVRHPMYTAALSISLGLAPHPDNPHQFINYIMDPAVIAKVSDKVRFANGNLASLPLISEQVRNDPAIFPGPEVRAPLRQDLAETPEFSREMNRAWTRIRTGQ